MISGLIGQALTACLLDGRVEQDLAAAGKRRRIMARLEEIGETHFHEPLTLAELCAALGVNARTLRLITHEYVGMGPTQYLRMHRVNRVRSALAAADPRLASVGDIAAEYGFWESGRFAAFLSRHLWRGADGYFAPRLSRGAASGGRAGAKKKKNRLAH